MAHELFINMTPFETRGVLMDNGTPVELFIERENTRDNIGNIYKGRVLRILPGMQSAFIDIGLEKAAFLYVKDLAQNYASYDDPFDTADDVGGEGDDTPHPPLRIQDLLKEGQEILVQTEKSPRGTKGARVGTNIALPGRYLVLLPLSDHIGVSHKIQDEGERERLKAIVDSLAGSMSDHRPGFIIRTAAEGKTEVELKRDMNYLVRLWEHIREKRNRNSAPSIVYQELDLPFRLVRDMPSGALSQITIDSKETATKLEQYIREFWPEEDISVRFYDDDLPLFDRYGFELEISKALDRSIWLKSGGYIVIDETEALTTVDVNTGRFVGKDNLEKTILQTNLEAAKEIAYQLRLRNIGGIIIIDFIDMSDQSSKDKVSDLLAAECARDRTKTFINPMSELGLVELTRKRARNSLSKMLGETCPLCEGRGFVTSRKTICNEIFRELVRSLTQTLSQKALVRVSREMGELFFGEERRYIDAAKSITKKDVLIEISAELDWHQYKVLYY